MRTESIKKNEITRSWYLVDAEGKNLGRLASKVAQVIRGKHKPNYTPNLSMGDFVIVVNAEKVKLSGKKESLKSYWRHSGYPSGDTTISFLQMKESFPERIIEKAVKGMLPHNKLGHQLNGALKVYAGPEHPHQAQQPQVLEV